MPISFHFSKVVVYLAAGSFAGIAVAQSPALLQNLSPRLTQRVVTTGTVTRTCSSDSGCPYWDDLSHFGLIAAISDQLWNNRFDKDGTLYFRGGRPIQPAGFGNPELWSLTPAGVFSKVANLPFSRRCTQPSAGNFVVEELEGGYPQVDQHNDRLLIVTTRMTSEFTGVTATCDPDGYARVTSPPRYSVTITTTKALIAIDLKHAKN
jgi:hypothetical protein